MRLLSLRVEHFPPSGSRANRNLGRVGRLDGKRALLTFSDHCDTSPQLSYEGHLTFYARQNATFIFGRERRETGENVGHVKFCCNSAAAGPEHE